MEGAAVIVVLLFVFSIFGSFGSKGYHQPVGQNSPSNISKPGQIIGEPDASYYAIDPHQAHRSIVIFVKKYRSADEAKQITDSIMTHSQKFDVNPKIVAALMSRESRFNPRAVSSSNAKGLGQLLPSTAKSLKVTDPFDIDQNSRGTVRYVRYLIDVWRDNPQKVSYALASYLEGHNAIRRNGGFKPATKRYVSDILKVYKTI